MNVRSLQARFEDLFNETRLGHRWLLVAAIADWALRATEREFSQVVAFVKEREDVWAWTAETTRAHAQTKGDPHFGWALNAETAIQDVGSNLTQKLEVSRTTCEAIEVLAQLAIQCALDTRSPLAAELICELIALAAVMPNDTTGIVRGGRPLMWTVATASSHYGPDEVRYGDDALLIEERRHILEGAATLRHNPGVATPLYEGRSP
ncbi:MAG: hypothetical protein WC817_03550 [Patescibacteria group bacterium]|jgi:hypothetical protein